MEEIDDEKLLEKNKEPNVENNDDNEFDEIFICYKLSSCALTIYIILSIIFPFLFYYFLIREPYKRFAKVDKKKKILYIYDRGIIKCCCRFVAKIYKFDDIKQIKLTVYDSPEIKKNITEKLYIIDGYVCKIDGDFDLGIHKKITKEKYDELVSFFKKYFDTSFQPLEYASKNDHTIEKNEINITNNEIQDNIENISKINESSQIPS